LYHFCIIFVSVIELPNLTSTHKHSHALTSTHMHSQALTCTHKHSHTLIRTSNSRKHCLKLTQNVGKPFNNLENTSTMLYIATLVQSPATAREGREGEEKRVEKECKEKRHPESPRRFRRGGASTRGAERKVGGREREKGGECLAAGVLLPSGIGPQPRE
jgi:hypothetical protein